MYQVLVHIVYALKAFISVAQSLWVLWVSGHTKKIKENIRVITPTTHTHTHTHTHTNFIKMAA